MRLPRIFAAFAATLALACSAHADLLVEYDFTGDPGDQTSEPPAILAFGVDAGAITRGSGITPNPGDNSINSQDWTTSLDPDPDDYYEFTVGPGGAAPLNLDVLVFTARRSATGPLALQVRADLGAFDFGTSTLLDLRALADVTSNFRVTIGLAGASILQGLAETATFRIYGYAAQGTTGQGTFRIGIDSSSAGSNLPANLQVLGTVVPEPGSLVLLGVGLAGMLAVAHRRRWASAAA